MDHHAKPSRYEIHVSGLLGRTIAHGVSGVARQDAALLRFDHRPAVRQLLARALPGAASESIERLADHARVTRVGRGDVIFRQGEPIPVTLVIHGHAALRRTTLDGRELVLGIAKPGCLFGWRIAGQAASVDLVAITPTDVALWSGADVRALMATDPGLAIGVIDGMGRDIVAISERIDGFIHQDARGRVLRVLAEYRDLLFGESPVVSRRCCLDWSGRAAR